LVFGRAASSSRQAGLTSESVEGAALPLEGVDNVHGGDSLPLGVLGVGDGVPDDKSKWSQNARVRFSIKSRGDGVPDDKSKWWSQNGVCRYSS